MFATQPWGPKELNPSDPQLRTVESNEYQEQNSKQLQNLIQRMRSNPSGPSQVDSAYTEFDKNKETCLNLCHNILQDDFRSQRSMSNGTESMTRRDSSIDSPWGLGGTGFDQRSSFSGRSLTEVASGSLFKSGTVNEPFLNAIREWKNWLETLCDAFRDTLAETYKSYERDATPEMIDLLFTSRKFRREAIHRMRNASVTRLLSADPQFFPRYEIRFRNYERVKQEATRIRQLLQSGESGIAPSRNVQEFLTIAPRGDSMLEFANFGTETTHIDPALRFRVSSHMLAETSPIFARMFSGHASALELHEDEDITPHLPPPPTPYICQDGSEVKLYRMPQYEVNRLQSLEILMYAAHMRNDQIPREVSFEQFVAVAECCIRYRSTAPLEPLVEHRWLPQWMHRGADDMPDGLLVISYAFGCRQLFTRMSKSAILNLTDENDLQTKPWPQKIKDKIWALRCAKVDQIYSCCTNAVQEYIRPPTRDPSTDHDSNPVSEAMISSQTPAVPPTFITTLTSSPRCPKGIHSCDAVNLGWMMLVLNEMNLLQHVLKPSVMSQTRSHEHSSRSLAQLVEILRMMPSPASPIHRGGVCDPSPAFRTAIADIYNSVNGLTLHNISGKSHGWALSKHRMTEPESLPASGLERMAGTDPHTVAAEFSGSIRLQILSELDDPRDVQAAAQINKGFYETYKTYEVKLLRDFLRADLHTRSGSPSTSRNPEEKIPKKESDKIKEEKQRHERDAVSLQDPDTEILSEDDDDDDEDNEGDDLDGVDGTETLPPNDVHSNGQLSVNPPRYAKDERSSADGGSPTTPTQASSDTPLPMRISPNKPNGTIADHVEEPPMTVEEAQRILWPKSIIPESQPSISRLPPGIKGAREKFLSKDPAFTEGLEDKTLVVTGEKQLRSEHDRRIGLLKTGRADRPGSSGDTSDGGTSKRG
ncbi:hypothetical protein QQS21_002282 [Conoideocrella luteorostrata]|uniref:BTB domain-containing protein n=1 Tax=Conoideocrella luteorostrata TaxID=1105319 RepID=A0AAJ0G1C7_9HYPO|nr:hypothetical protein QQS21_002282 [Conoideocrella luteorostrata]